MARISTSAAGPSRSSPRDIPYIGLKDAIEKARTLKQKANRSSIRPDTAATYLGHSPTSSTASLVLAALKKFGLIEFDKTSEGRSMRLSELGYAIVADSRGSSPDRDKRIREAALLPKAHLELWEEFGAELPDDETLRTYLVMQRAYSDNAANLLIRVYRETITFSGHVARGTLGDGAAEEAHGELVASDRETAAESIMGHVRPTPVEFHSPGVAAPVRTLTIPLISTRTFEMTFPTDLSKDDFNFVIENIKLWEPLIVAR
jgi:hypothetical protein